MGRHHSKLIEKLLAALRGLSCDFEQKNKMLSAIKNQFTNGVLYRG